MIYRARLVCPLPLLVLGYQKDVNEKSGEILSSCEVRFPQEETLPASEGNRRDAGVS